MVEYLKKSKAKGKASTAKKAGRTPRNGK